MSEVKQYIEHVDPPQNDEGWIEYSLQLLWSEMDGYERAADNAAAELAALRERMEGLEKRILELQELAESHRAEYNRRAGVEHQQKHVEDMEYWKGRRDEAGYFRDKLALQEAN